MVMSKYNERRLLHGEARADDIAKFYNWTIVAFGYVSEGTSFADPRQGGRRIDLDWAATNAVHAYACARTGKVFFTGHKMADLIQYTHSDDELAFVAQWLAKNKLQVSTDNVDKARRARYGGGFGKRVGRGNR